MPENQWQKKKHLTPPPRFHWHFTGDEDFTEILQTKQGRANLFRAQYTINAIDSLWCTRDDDVPLVESYNLLCIREKTEGEYQRAIL